MSEGSWLDATAQAELVRRGEVSPVELVDAAIARIERLDAHVGAIAWRRFDTARREAAGDLPDGPFRGVPILLKDAGAHIAGEPTTHGVAAMEGVPHAETSYVAQLLRDAGFVVLGRTKVPELTTSVTTEPRAGTTARNPWNPAHSTGGSSGGSAAAVAAGMVAVAHASDGGGSIRIPASACGLVGLKPSRGRVTHGPLLAEEWSGGVTEGVVTRTVRDTAAVLDVLSAVLPGEPYTAPPLPGPLRDEVGLEPPRLRIGFVDRPPADSTYLDDPECRLAVTTTAALLGSLGHQVTESHPDALWDADFTRHFGAVIAADIAREVREFERMLGRPIADDELEPRNVVYRGWGSAMSAADFLAAQAWLSAWRRRFASWWTSYDVLLTPTVGSPAPELGWLSGLSGDGDAPDDSEAARMGSFIPYTPQVNMGGQPAVSLPLHWSASGLPVGVQLVAAYGREDLLVRLAAQLEAAAPWADRHPPSLLA